MPGNSHLEVERKYVVDEASVVPMQGGPTGSRWERGPVLELSAVYFDTTDLDLARRGITLRRRTGGDDEGWHVKVPHTADARTELRHPLGRYTRTVPRKVVDPVRAVVRDRVLLPVATLSTTRITYDLIGDDGLLATLCDDRVSAQSLLPDGGGGRTWREWEVEVANDVSRPRSVLKAVESELKAAGARRSRVGSKLHKVLGVDRDWDAEIDGVHASDDIVTVLRLRLRQQIAELHAQDAALRTGDSSSIHQMRIAARRLRAAITTCQPALDIDTEHLRSELRWLGQILGPARDVQVTWARLQSSLEELPAELVLGPVRRRLDVWLRAREREMMRAVQDVLVSDRYYALLDALDILTRDLSLTEPPGRPAGTTLAKLVQRDARRLHRAVRLADGTVGLDRDMALHEVRKKAKRLRYAAELAEGVSGRRAARVTRAAKHVQQVLGQHQDTVTARRTLRELGVQSFLQGENGFTFGLLFGLEELRAGESEAAFERAWTQIPSPRVARRWVAKG